MGKFVDPKVFLIAETRSVFDGEAAMFKHMDVGFSTDAESDGERLIEIAGKLCYMAFDPKLNKNLTKTGTKDNKKYIGNILEHKHGSVLEHATVTMVMMDVSRIVTHELVRHRAGTAYSQLSGRYVRSDEINMYLPNCIKEEPRAVAVFERAMKQMEENIAELTEIYGIDNMTTQAEFAKKKVLTSAFRRLAGNGQTNHIVVTGNHRAWLHMIFMRTSIHAEEEIRVAYNLAFNQLADRYPAVYQDCVRVYDNGVDGLFSVGAGHGSV